MQSISWHILPIVSQSVIFSVMAMRACLQTHCVLILLQHIACSCWILTSRTFPQLQSLHCAPPTSQVPQFTITRGSENLFTKRYHHFRLSKAHLCQTRIGKSEKGIQKDLASSFTLQIFPASSLCFSSPSCESKCFGSLDQAWSLSAYCLQLMGSHSQNFPFSPFTVRLHKHSTCTNKSNHLNWTCALLCQHVNICS